jgi:hypothetical protein
MASRIKLKAGWQRIDYYARKGFTRRATNCYAVLDSSGLIAYYSYETIVALKSFDNKIYVRGGKWTNSTTRHINLFKKYAFDERPECTVEKDVDAKSFWHILKINGARMVFDYKGSYYDPIQ